MVNGRVSDISTSGLRVQAPIELTAGDKVTLRVTLPGPVDRAEMVAVKGRVVRSDMGGIAVDIVGAGGGLPERAMRWVGGPRLIGWESRRRSPRVHLPVVVTLGHAGGAQVPAETVDLSTFGARITTGLVLRAGERLDVLLPADGDPEPLSVRAVVWEVGNRGAALVFVNVPAPDFERLSRFVSALLEEP
jgi:PilZ domain-containing protein